MKLNPNLPVIASYTTKGGARIVVYVYRAPSSVTALCAGCEFTFNNPHGWGEPEIFDMKIETTKIKAQRHAKDCTQLST